MLRLLLRKNLVLKVLYVFYDFEESDKLLIILKIMRFNNRGMWIGELMITFLIINYKSMLVAYRIMFGWTRVYFLFLG